jgi:hypothetical protein
VLQTVQRSLSAFNQLHERLLCLGFVRSSLAIIKKAVAVLFAAERLS